MKKLAIITGADGCMGSEIARAVAIEGYHVIMASKNLERAEEKRKWIISESGNEDVEIIPIDLSSLKTVKAFADEIKCRGEKVALLMNNSGILEQEGRTITEDGMERTVQVNYVGPFFPPRLVRSRLEPRRRYLFKLFANKLWGRIYFPAFL